MEPDKKMIRLSLPYRNSLIFWYLRSAVSLLILNYWQVVVTSFLIIFRNEYNEIKSSKLEENEIFLSSFRPEFQPAPIHYSVLPQQTFFQHPDANTTINK